MSKTGEGVRSCYCLNWENMEAMAARFEAFAAALRALKPEAKCC